MKLTPTGDMLLQYADKLLGVYKELEFDMNLLVKQHTGTLRIGGINTLSQHVIPPVLAQFHQKFEEVQGRSIP